MFRSYSAVFRGASWAAVLAATTGEATPLGAQTPATVATAAAPLQSPLRSPVVGQDGRVTVSLRAPKAAEVRITSGELLRAVGAEGLKMSRSDEGVWSATFGPVPPGIYDLAYDVDGVRVTDPLSTDVFGNRTGSRGYLEIPGPPGVPRIDQWRDVPHGTVVQHWYASKATGTRRRVHVYVPPSAEPREAPRKKLPVLYLLHGAGDDDRHWSLLGQAHVIADNLLAEQKIKPLLIVMPEGHPAGGPPNLPRDSEERRRYSAENARLFEQDLLDDVGPLVETHYPVQADAAGRAIVGLSMGGRQALGVGLAHTDRFAWIGSFSGAATGIDDAVARLAADPKRANERIRLLWIGIGKDDGLLTANRDFTARLQAAGIEHEYVETEGAHNWSLWRQYLAGILPRLFRDN